jgi:hypothetical protein
MNLSRPGPGGEGAVVAAAVASGFGQAMV